MKTRHVDCPRSAIIVFRFVIIFGEVSEQASYADSRTLCGLACAPRTSLTPGCPVEKPAVSDAATGYGSFNLLSRRSLHFELQVEIMR